MSFFQRCEFSCYSTLVGCDAAGDRVEGATDIDDGEAPVFQQVQLNQLQLFLPHS
jgi:hypothetical protein